MTNKTRYAIGLAMGIFGIAFLLLNALDYLLKWDQIGFAILPIGIMLALIGAGFMESAKRNQKKQ